VTQVVKPEIRDAGIFPSGLPGRTDIQRLQPIGTGEDEFCLATSHGRLLAQQFQRWAG
jgi:hypothetical protein